MTRTYLDMMIKSLDEKIEILTRICELNAEQKSILSSEEGVDLEAFRQNVDEKGMLIERINTLNDGFDSLYDHVKKDLEEDKKAFSEEIKKMQNQIREITSLSSTIKAEEVRNKALAEKFFKNKRSEIRANQKGNTAAYNYFETMSKSGVIMPQFIDKKK
ncbi:MAG: flagellar protein FliT [Butyrivibrio sp.]|jgi:putative protein kinase ArgK-like GTPase of G3E family|nr:flagellar protein FliT [Butyrivibrio sp.]